MFENHAIDLFTDKSKEKGITVFLEMLYSAKIAIHCTYAEDHKLSRIWGNDETLEAAAKLGD